MAPISSFVPCQPGTSTRINSIQSGQDVDLTWQIDQKTDLDQLLLSWGEATSFSILTSPRRQTIYPASYPTSYLVSGLTETTTFLLTAFPRKDNPLSLTATVLVDNADRIFHDLTIRETLTRTRR
ncbi:MULTISPECIES: hypothetical protein [Streptomyces]|uniref:hypothetical protein n=1 Tax=Streptomyces TaxID=1883 RepID=UPI00345C60F4